MRRTAAVLAHDVFVLGVGVVPVTRKNPRQTLAKMGHDAVAAALANSGVNRHAIGGLYAGNMMGGMLSQQQHVSALIATDVGLAGVDAMTVESCCGAGGGALRMGYLAVASGEVDTAVVVGVEQMTHRPIGDVTEALASAAHWENEGATGETFVTLNGKLQKLYRKRYGVAGEQLAHFGANAHRNALTAPHAVLKKNLTVEDYAHSRMVVDPIRVMDASPVCDGAAAVILSREKPSGHGVKILASASASDVLTVMHREDPLELRGVALSTSRALLRAGLARKDIDIFELHDAYSIMACLSLEAAGFAKRGEAAAMAAEGAFARDGDLPIATFGGLKARGHPVGATGVYQAAEMFMQLTNSAGENQVSRADVAMLQNIGGAGSTVFTHIFSRV